MISCIEQGIKYAGINGTGKYGIPHLVNDCSEINLLVNSMQNLLGLRYTTLLINFHNKTKCDNAVIRSTVNLAFRRLLPKITKNQKINKERRMRVSGKRQVIDK